MAEIGYFALLVAFVLSAYAVVAGFWGARLGNIALVRSAERTVLAVWILVSTAVAGLLYYLLASDFSLEYVANYTNRDLPIFYKIAGFWAGQTGSLLFWTFLLTCYSGFVVLQNRHRNRVLMPYVVCMMMATTFFFLSLNLFVANPFERLGVIQADGSAAFYAPADGRGLNPLLQYFAMVIHPPVLFLGYVGFTVPFAFAMAALFSRQLGDAWIRTTRRWTMLAWGFQSMGILLGAKWAYVELGWGGYWAWDPVENASLMPWLTATAYLHSVMVQERKGMLKVWNMVLVIGTFLLCILGTFLTRSGVVSSVHAFAQSNIGPFFVTFMVVMVLLSTGMILLRLDYLKSENQLDSLISRESSFLFNNLILLVACFAVLWGTIFPIISEAVQGEKITVGPPFFNKVNIPIALLLMLLTGVGPLFAWRKTSTESLRKNFLIPTVLSLLFGAGLFALGVHHVYALMCYILCFFVTATIVAEFYKGTRTRMKSTSENAALALFNLSFKNTRRYGGYIVHFGMVLIFVALAGAAFNKETEKDLAQGESIKIAGYELKCEGIKEGDTANYSYSTATMNVFKYGKPFTTMLPEKRLYKASQQPTSEVALYSTLREDLYVVYKGDSDDGAKAVIQVYVNPLVKWLWIGGLVVVLGTGMAMLPNRTGLSRNAIRRKEEGNRVGSEEPEHASVSLDEGGG
jgi:cytochrome c-type biogenesis protein CcmF